MNSLMSFITKKIKILISSNAIQSIISSSIVELNKFLFNIKSYHNLLNNEEHSIHNKK